MMIIIIIIIIILLLVSHFNRNIANLKYFYYDILISVL